MRQTSDKEKNWIETTKSWRPISMKLLEITLKILDNYQLRQSESFHRHRTETIGEVKFMKIYNQIKAIELHLKDISTSLTYLRLKRIDPILKSNKIGKIDYIRFNFENHLIRVVSCPDLLAILGDMVYETGLDERKINWDTFSKHEKIKNLECAAILSSFADEIQQIRKERHKIIHYGGNKNQIIESIYNHTFDKKDLTNIGLWNGYFETIRLEETKRLVREMKKNYNLCYSHCKDFISSLASGIECIDLN